MVLLLTDVFLLLTQVLLWLVIGLITWFVLLKALPRAFLGLLVLLLILVILALAFVGGAPRDGGVLEILWRIISFPLTPLGLALIFLALLLSGAKLAKWVRRVILVGLILLALGSVPFIAYFMAQELEMEAIELVRATPALPAGARRVIVLMGQGTTRLQLQPRVGAVPTNPPDIERPILEDTFQILSQLPIQITEKGDRIIYAAQLYREEIARGTSPLVVVSAGRRFDRLRREGDSNDDVSEAIAVRQMLTRTFNVPEGDILLEGENGNVRNSAVRVRDLLNQRGINYGNQVVLVTSAIPMNRAALTFQRAFSPSTNIVVRPTDFRTLPQPGRLQRVLQGRDLIERQFLVIDFLPSAEAFCLASEAIEEYITSMYYFLRGWISPLQGFVPPPPPPPT